MGIHPQGVALMLDRKMFLSSYASQPGLPSEPKAEEAVLGCGAWVVGAWFLAMFHERIDEYKSSVPVAAIVAKCPCPHGDTPFLAEGVRRRHSVRHRADVRASGRRDPAPVSH